MSQTARMLPVFGGPRDGGQFPEPDPVSRILAKRIFRLWRRDDTDKWHKYSHDPLTDRWVYAGASK